MKELNPLLHSRLRLAIMSILINVEHADFAFLKEKTSATSGNLSIQINKLKDADYIKVKKTFKDNYPLTTCTITKKGRKAFEEYYQNLKSYFDKDL